MKRIAYLVPISMLYFGQAAAVAGEALLPSRSDAERDEPGALIIKIEIDHKKDGGEDWDDDSPIDANARLPDPTGFIRIDEAIYLVDTKHDTTSLTLAIAASAALRSGAALTLFLVDNDERGPLDDRICGCTNKLPWPGRVKTFRCQHADISLRWNPWR
jgi:hypothetical protein